MTAEKQAARVTTRRARVLRWLTRLAKHYAERAVFDQSPGNRTMYAAQAAALTEMVHTFARGGEA